MLAAKTMDAHAGCFRDQLSWLTTGQGVRVQRRNLVWNKPPGSGRLPDAKKRTLVPNLPNA